MPESSVVVGYSSTTSAHQSFGLQGNNSPPPPSPSNCCYSSLLSPFSQTLSGTQGSWNEIPFIHYHRVYGLVLGRNSLSKVSVGPGKPYSRFL